MESTTSEKDEDVKPDIKPDIKTDVKTDVKPDIKPDVDDMEEDSEGDEADDGGADADEVDDKGLKKPPRRRRKKRQLYPDLVKQLQFYFSDANITKNRLMLEMITGSEYVPLNNFMDFNRIKSLTSNVEDLRRALGAAEGLELSPDGTGVKRKVPYDVKKVKSEAEVDECTIYVENVPRHVDHAWLEKIFLTFGPIAYVSLPKFKRTGQPKGFAFIEFDTIEGAKGCIEAYRGEGFALPSDMNPAELMSIQTFKEEEKQNKIEMRKKTPPSITETPSQQHPPGTTDAAATASDTVVSSEDTSDAEKARKRKLDDDNNDDNTSDLPTNKRAREIVPSGSPSPLTSPIVDSASGETPTYSEVDLASVATSRTSTTVVEMEVGKSVTASKAKKRKRKKNKNKHAVEEKLESDSIHLKVMSKKHWKQLRNRYLNLQRQNMAKFKKEMRDHRLRTEHYSNCPRPAPPTKNEKPFLPYIVGIEMDTAVDSADKFKTQVQVDLAGQSEEEAAISQFVKYIDYKEGSMKAYIRFNQDESFKERIQDFVHNAEKVFKSARFLNAQESDDYKAKVHDALKQNKTLLPRKRERGKDRLVKMAMKPQHTRFYDSAEEDGDVNGDEDEVFHNTNGQGIKCEEMNDV